MDFVSRGRRRHKTTINRREKVRKVKNAFQIVRLSNEEIVKRVKLRRLMWKNCVCPEIRLTTLVHPNCFRLPSPWQRTFALFKSASNWLIAVSSLSLSNNRMKKDSTSVLQNYLFCVALSCCQLQFSLLLSCRKIFNLKIIACSFER